LRALAKEVKVSASFLSQVENGKVAPSLSTLAGLANALESRIGILLGEYTKLPYVNPVVPKKKRMVMKNMGHGVKIELLTPQNNRNVMQGAILAFNSRSSTGSSTGHYAQHMGQETGLVLEGSVALVYGNKERRLEAGDSFYINSNVPHEFKGIDGESRILIVATPPVF